jgi:uncharacterized protein YfkK (UPF0435 family)
LKTFILILFFLNLSNSYPQELFNETNQNKINKEEILAEVDTIKITAEEFYYNYEFGPAFPKRKSNSKETHLNYIINEKLLALEGYTNGSVEQDYAKGLFNDIQSDLATEELFREEILPKVEINENEIEKVIGKKLIEYEVRWLYSDSQQSLEYYLEQLKNSVPFDTLFYAQINDSVFADDREMKSNLYNIYVKNPLFAQILDTLKAGNISAPIHTDDGWYIVKIDNVWENLITNETEQNKLRYESIEALTKSKMDILSDEYVNALFVDENPIIKRDAFNILRSYLGKIVLTSEKYSEWELEKKLDTALSNLGLKKGEKYPGISLVNGMNNNFSIDEFIIWYRNREQYVKFLKDDLIDFSKSLENLVWLMVRDKLLVKTAIEKGYDKSDWVKKQSGWWKDKISYSVYRNELANSITLNSEEISLAKEKKKTQSEILSEKLSEKILHKILELKQKYKVIINKDVLDKIQVSSEDDEKAIDMYLVKRGNLIPRPVYPSIDNDWASWE